MVIHLVPAFVVNVDSMEYVSYWKGMSKQKEEVNPQKSSYSDLRRILWAVLSVFDSKA
jgi:hypothetical protein